MNFAYKTAVAAVTVLATATSCIQKEALNTECDILTCEFPSEILMASPIITNNSVTVNVLPDADISALSPVFTLTEGATISPASGSVQDFLNAEDHTVSYTTTSQDGEWSKDYRVRVVQQQKPSEYYFNKVELDPSSRKYSIFNEYSHDDAGWHFLMAWASGNPGYVMCGEADKKAKAQYGNDNYKDHIWEYFPTLAVYPEGTEIRTNADNVANFMLGDEYATPEYIRLVTRSTGGFGKMVAMPIASGNIFMGEFDLENAVQHPREATKFGEPYLYKPLKVSGEFRYKAGDTFTDEKGKTVDGQKDKFSIYAVFFLSDENTQYIDGNEYHNNFNNSAMVAVACLDSSLAIETGLDDDNWTTFEINFDYDRYNKEIDKALLAKGRYKLGIVIASSAEGDYFKGAVGSTLDIRNLKIVNE